MYIREDMLNNISIEKYLNKHLNAKLVKIRWNKKLRCTQAVFGIRIENKTVFAVDMVTMNKRELYLSMCHAKPNTLAMAQNRTNASFQCSLAACFGYVDMCYDICAVVEPYRDRSGNIGIHVLETYSNRK